MIIQTNEKLKVTLYELAVASCISGLRRFAGNKKSLGSQKFKQNTHLLLEYSERIHDEHANKRGNKRVVRFTGPALPSGKEVACKIAARARRGKKQVI